ncbi:MAG TPA: Vms1/Ankzf1 family peptidyl-tRNA hydrolase [Thermoleophilaceae bacterium]|nr:Vms1/Ankzf1 family peptidyl-tRNA hydrolase [Thermoleophilaceae bacterium]
MSPDAGCVLSVYVNLDPSEFATGPARSSALRSVADEASRAVENGAGELSHEVRLRLREDVERIRAYAGSADFDGTHGLAIFSAGGGDMFEVLHLPSPVPNAVVVDGSPHVAPLVGEPDGAWCVVLVNRRNARILSGDLLGLGEEERIADDVPGRHDQGGWSQARYQRHIDEEARRHLERVAEAVSERCRRGAFDHLLVGGPEEGYSEFVELLDNECRERLCGRVAVDVENTTVAQVAEAALPLMREHHEAQRDELLQALAQGVGAGGRGAAGLGAVLDCLNEQRVETLLLDGGFAATGAECPTCGWLTADEGGECPADGAELKPCRDLVEPAVHRALAQDADVVRLRDRPEMQAHGGIAALLRF